MIAMNVEDFIDMVGPTLEDLLVLWNPNDQGMPEEIIEDVLENNRERLIESLDSLPEGIALDRDILKVFEAGGAYLSAIDIFLNYRIVPLDMFGEKYAEHPDETTHSVYYRVDSYGDVFIRLFDHKNDVRVVIHEKELSKHQ